MAVAVKKLNSLDIPVPTMEVCYFFVFTFTPKLTSCMSAYRCSNVYDRPLLLVIHAGEMALVTRIIL